MVFGQYRSIEIVLREYPLKVASGNFLPESRLDLSETFMQNLRFSLQRRMTGDSESFYTENFVYPFLQQAWMRHEKLHVWSHRSLVADDTLYGEPDYFISAWPSGIADHVVQHPLMAVIEAKRQDFEEGWGQCLAALLACQKVNADKPFVVYGIVSTGLIWEFAKLDQKVFTRQPLAYSLSDPNLVFGLIDSVFAECERQLDNL